MNYDLAKKLAGAGFPQKPTEMGYLPRYVSKWRGEEQINDLDAEESYYLPTLTELINECVRDTNKVSPDSFSLHQAGDMWEALAKKRGDISRTARQGSTHRVAVANLYLALRPVPLKE